MAELRKVSYPPGNEPSGRKVSYELAQVNVASRKNQPNGNADVPAVVLRNASKHYKKGVPVLQNFNMTVKRGAIYSLLGSSGAGKTTTLSVIVGVRKLNSGSVYVFGYEPGVKGNKVGFMPQETSLYDDFSIAETLAYFGTLCGMSRNAAAKSTAFLTDLLRLPDSSQRVGTLSGGQRRRAAFAVALIHDKCYRGIAFADVEAKLTGKTSSNANALKHPELLVLDEPTVGVDPLLRESIWKHLVRLSTERGTTVLITTHYIDEAKESSMVGVMRYGRLLVEQDPSVLLQRFNTTSLENVVLQLCRSDEADGKNGDSNKKSNGFHHAKLGEDYSPDDSEFIPPTEEVETSEKIMDSMKRLSALVHKNLVILFRNLLLFIFSVIMPAFIIMVMCIAFKDDPKHLNFGIVNHEVSNSSWCFNIPPNTPGECDIENLSCRYIKNFPEGILDLISYDTEDEALAAVHAGSIWGYMKFPPDFSSIFYERSATGANVDEDVLNKSEIIVKMDQTSKNIYGKVKKSLHDGFEDFAKAILKDCGFDERQGAFPLQYDTPIFGTDGTKFIDFVAPSITVAWLYFFPIIAASIRYINEKKQGTYERSLVAGTKTWEVLCAYGCTECIVLIAQSILSFIVLNVIIGIEILGSIPLVVLLFIMSGFGGVSMGFFIGSLCNEEIEAALLAMALFFPNVFLSGLIWPLEGMPLILQYIAYVLPCTTTGESMRSLFARGWPFSHPSVWPGYVSLTFYILLYFLLTVLIQKVKTK